MPRELDERLVEAVSAFDLEGVRAALDAGADPNYDIELPELYAKSIEQPTRPLKLVMFRISDSFVDDAALGAFAAIAQLLVDHGADPLPAMAIAEARYGPYDPDATGPAADVWHVVARAAGAR